MDKRATCSGLSRLMLIKQFVKPEKQMCKMGGCEWSVPRLWQLAKNLEVMEIPLIHLNIYNTFRSLTIRELAGHIVAVNNADLKYPIILDEDGEIMDGRHRIIKALITNKKTIKAVRFETNPPPCRIDEDDKNE